MPYVVISLIAVLAILLLQASDAIPVASVGGPMVIALVSFIAVFAVALFEAWEKRRGILGWILNVVAVFFGVVTVAPIGGAAVALLLGPFMSGSRSLAHEGGALMAIALAGMMMVTIATAWASLWVVNRWRDRQRPAASAEL